MKRKTNVADAEPIFGEIEPVNADDIVDLAYLKGVRRRIALARERLQAEVECDDPDPII